jgi:hypothetical protein
MLLQAIQFSLHAYYFVGGLRRDRHLRDGQQHRFMGVLLCILVGTLLAWRRRARAAK